MASQSPCVDLAVQPDGEVPPILLLHSLAMDRSIWDAHVAALAGRYPVITVDLPGHGRACTTTQVTIEWMADEVAAAVQATPYEGVVVAGLSLGGMVAQALAIRYPDLVAGLCLVDTTAWYGDDAPERWEERAQRVMSDGFDALTQFQLDRWFSSTFRQSHPEVAARLLDIFRRNDAASYAATCRAMGAYDGRERLTSITAPTLVLVGEHDAATPVPHAQDLARRIPGAQLRVLPGLSHMSPIEAPAHLLEALDALHDAAVRVS